MSPLLDERVNNGVDVQEAAPVNIVDELVPHVHHLLFPLVQVQDIVQLPDQVLNSPQQY